MSGDLYADLHGECDEREHEKGPGDEEAADDVGQYDGDQWAAAFVSACPAFTCCILYLETCVRLDGANFQRLRQMADLILSLKVPFIAVGD